MNSVCVVAVRHQEDPVVVSGIGLAVAADDVFASNSRLFLFMKLGPSLRFCVRQ